MSKSSVAAWKKEGAGVRKCFFPTCNAVCGYETRPPGKQCASHTGLLQGEGKLRICKILQNLQPPQERACSKTIEEVASK